MNERTSFLSQVDLRRGDRGCCSFPLVAGSARRATVSEPGGKLAQLREAYGLSQANLGEVDPASETIKLATLGLRGVAVNLLWEKANYYKKTEDWTNLTATLEQLAKLQPNFITFWKFQAWNLTLQRLGRVRRLPRPLLLRAPRHPIPRTGRALQSQQPDNPQLLWDLGWFIGQKIGRADEHVQYRRLFKADDDLHPPDRAPDDRDNWLVGKEWYDKAIEAVDFAGKSFGRKSPIVFFSGGPKSQMSYGEAIEDDGLFETGKKAWELASRLWRDFGDRDIEHSTGVILNLNDEAELQAKVEELRKQLEALGPKVRDELLTEAQGKLSAEEQAVLAKPMDKLTPAEQETFYKLQDQLTITDDKVAARLAEQMPDRKREILKLAADLRDTEREANFTGNYKENANFEYWKTRADFEQTEDALKARELLHQARRAYRDNADPVGARKFYEESFARWKKVLDEFPTLRDPDGTTGDDIIEYIKEYKTVLEQDDETIPADFPLWDIIENFDSEMNFEAELRAARSAGRSARSRRIAGSPRDPKFELASVKADRVAIRLGGRLICEPIFDLQSFDATELSRVVRHER